jgi:Coenzyme PQQ synthesis protein D (PqqD)
MADLKSVPVHLHSVVAGKTAEGIVLVPVTGNVADMNSLFSLNATGSFIWEQIDGVKCIEEIAMIFSNRYSLDYKTAERDVFRFIEKAGNYHIVRKNLEKH